MRALPAALLVGLLAPASAPAAEARHETRRIEGWAVRVSRTLLAADPELTERAISLLTAQLKKVAGVVPPAPLSDLRRVTLWVSPEYPGTPPRAEYHPGEQWLKENGRDPAMVHGVEFTNVRIFEAETRRMPLLALHELAHAYHHRVLGHDHAGIREAFEAALKSGKYDRVERRDAEGRTRLDRAYALANPQEYFAEGTEAFFGANDFYPYTREELRSHDPGLHALLARLWRMDVDRVSPDATASNRSTADECRLPRSDRLLPDPTHAMPAPLLYLSPENVRRSLPMSEAIEAMRDAFSQLARDEAELPPRQHMAGENGGVALVMPCYSRTSRILSLKSVTVYDENPPRGLPRIQSLVLLTDGDTGAPLGILDGASLTAIRTGAASGLATDLLARPGAQSAAVIGAGVHARTQLAAVCAVRPIRRARVFCRTPERSAQFTREMSAELGIDVEAATSPGEAVRGAEVVCTATPARSPVLEDQDLHPGCHLNAIGAFKPEMVEIPPETVARARVVVDHLQSALEEAGDLLGPLHAGRIARSHIEIELGDVLLGRAAGRRSSDEITLFKSVGVAIQDLCAAARALRRARECGLGLQLPGA